jgi:chromosome segregation ATPase
MFAIEPRPWKPRCWRAALVLAVSGALIGAALAQQAPSREEEQIRRLRQQLQQLQQEVAAARQAEGTARAEAAQQVSEAQAEAARARSGTRAQAERIAALEAELATQRMAASSTATALARSEGELATARQSLEVARIELERRAAGLRDAERSGGELLARFRQQNAALDLCTRNNQALRTLSLELLDRWQRHDWRDVLAAREPFIQSRRVTIENLVQGYEDRIERAWLAPESPQ